MRASVLIFFQLSVYSNKSKLHSLAKFLLVLPDSFSEWSGVWRWISSWGDWPKARDSFKRQMEQNGFDIVVLLTLIINFGLLLCSSCFGALCGCYHLYMLFISFILMILVTQSLLKPSYCQFRLPRQLVVRSDGLLRRRPNKFYQISTNATCFHRVHPEPTWTNRVSTSCFRVFVFSPGSRLPFAFFMTHLWTLWRHPNPSERSRARGHAATLTRLSYCCMCMIYHDLSCSIYHV